MFGEKAALEAQDVICLFPPLDKNFGYMLLSLMKHVFGGSKACSVSCVTGFCIRGVRGSSMSIKTSHLINVKPAEVADVRYEALMNSRSGRTEIDVSDVPLEVFQHGALKIEVERNEVILEDARTYSDDVFA